MADINRVMLVGRLTRDAELKSLPSGQAVCKFSIAVNRLRKNGEQWENEPNYFDVVLWGKRGESVHQYLVKGKMIGLDGELRQDRWQQEGQNRSKVEIIANNVQLLGSNPGSSGSGEGSDYESRRPQSQSQGQSWQSGDGPAEDSFADDIPF
jgi:single-strand DNA-binding protein